MSRSAIVSHIALYAFRIKVSMDSPIRGKMGLEDDKLIYSIISNGVETGLLEVMANDVSELGAEQLEDLSINWAANFLNKFIDYLKAIDAIPKACVKGALKFYGEDEKSYGIFLELLRLFCADIIRSDQLSELIDDAEAKELLDVVCNLERRA